MKKLLLISIAILLSFSLFGQYKVKERSSKRMPSWVNAVEKEYIIVTAKGADIEEAKTAALSAVKQQISESVASRIVAETNLQSHSIEINDSYSYTQQLKTNINSRTAKLPFMNEISLSKASEYYWEIRQIKATKAMEAFYAVKYPFSDFEMKKLVMEYQRHDAALNEKLTAFENGLNTVESIEDIDKAIVDLKAFMNEFLTDDPRYSKTESISNQYRKLYEYIIINAQQVKKGQITVSLILNDRQISSRQKPTIKANFQNAKITTSYEGDILNINYDDFACYDEDENTIEIRYRLGNKFGSQRVFIKTKLNISLTGTIFKLGSKQPVPFAKITLVPGGKTIVAGVNGVYQFNDLPSGNYSIQVIRKGYEAAQQSVLIGAGMVIRDITLVPDNEEAARETLVPFQPQPQSDPANIVRNGLVGYYRFNYSTANEVGSTHGQLVGSPQYVEEAKDGTKALQFDPIDGGYFLIPKGMIQEPYTNYSISFWAKGLSNGHIFSSTAGSTSSMDNSPRLIMENMQLKLINRYSDEVLNFSHAELSYDWHFIAVVVKNEDNNCNQTLYIDGQPVDNISFQYTFSFKPTKFLFGGQGMMGMPAIGMSVDNLRIYNARSLTDDEIMAIYQAEL